jgi:hypothetical protein
MPVNIYDLESDRKTVTLEFGSDSLTVTYKPNALTPARELAILRQARSESDDEAGDDDELARAEFNISRQLLAFTELVEAWDFMGPLARDAKGDRLDIPKALTDHLEIAAYCESQGGKLVVPPEQVVPIRPEFLELIGSNFLMLITSKINEDMRPDPKRRRR